MEEKFDTMLSEDYDDDGELNVEHYPIPKGLQRAWDALSSNEELEKGLNSTVATALTYSGDKSPGPGLGVNHYIKTPMKKPKRKQMKDEDDPVGVKRAIKEPRLRSEQVIRTEKETYTGLAGIQQDHDYVIPEGLHSPVSSEEVEENRKQTEKKFGKKKTNGNRVDIKRGWK